MAPQVGSQRRNVRLHIQQALAKSPGTFLTVGDIARTITDEYNTITRPSSRAIMLNLFREGGIPRADIEGVESVIINGTKGARSIVTKKPAAKKMPAKRAITMKAPAKRARTKVELKPEVVEDNLTATIVQVANASAAKQRRNPIDLKPGSRAHQGILDRLTGVAYCNVMLEPGRERAWAGANEEIVGREEFVAWLNKKNGPYLNGERFEIIDVVGADRDQRENSGINRFYNAWLGEAEDFRISAAMKMMLDTFSAGITFHRSSGKWRFSSAYEHGGRGGYFVLFLAEHAKISVRNAHRVFLSYVLEQFGEEFMAKIDLPTDEDLKKIEAQVARQAAEKSAREKSTQA